MSENGGLDLLIETETRLAERLATAQQEADSALDAARQAGREAEARFQDDLERAARDLATTLASQRESEVARITAEADVSAHRFESLGPGRLDALAQDVARRVLDAWRIEGAA
jgi:vacuolar-type H+-ATPase subunit H